MNQRSSFDLEDWALQRGGLQSIVSSSSDDSESIASLPFPLPPTFTPQTSLSISGSQSINTVSDATTRLVLSPPVILYVGKLQTVAALHLVNSDRYRWLLGRSFVKGSRLFKLRYSYIDIFKDDNGSLKHLVASETTGNQWALTHTFQGTTPSIPHIEQPTVSKERPPFRISFLEGQMIEVARTAFLSKPSYTFESWDDCVRFQEALLAQKVLFVAGIAEAKSKGRGEECISQNLRVLQAANGSHTIIFFANSQRKERKRYVSVPVNCIDRIDQSKKPGRLISLRLKPNSNLLSELKALEIRFLEDEDQKQFHQLLSAGVDG